MNKTSSSKCRLQLLAQNMNRRSIFEKSITILKSKCKVLKSKTKHVYFSQLSFKMNVEQKVTEKKSLFTTSSFEITFLCKGKHTNCNVTES